MTPEERKKLIIRNAVEVINEEKIDSLLNKEEPTVYCGYEPSGEVHIGHLVTITKLIDMEKAGLKIKVLFADWHAWLNRKGDWDFINEQIEIWKKAFKASGLKNPEFVIGTSFQRKLDYIDELLTISQKITLNRALRSMQQVARDIEHARVSQVIYPLMQILDIKYLNLDFVEAGIEQRKIHMLGQELFENEINHPKPVFIHTPLIPSLQGPEAGKMSSSDENSIISVRDNEEDIKKKLGKAYCPAGVVEENPVLMIAKLIIFPRLNEGEPFIINRPEKFGGKLEYHTYEALEEAYKDGLHPLDLKNAVAEYLTKILKPIRKEFGYEN